MESRPNAGDDLLRPQFENILNIGRNKTNTSMEQKPQDEFHHRPDSTRNVPKIPIPSANSFTKDVQASSLSTHTSNQLPSEEIATTAASERKIGPYWESAEDYDGKSL